MPLLDLRAAFCFTLSLLKIMPPNEPRKTSTTPRKTSPPIKVTPILTIPPAPIRDKRYSIAPIRFVYLLLIFAPIALGVMLRKHQPVPIEQMRQTVNGRWGRATTGSICYGLTQDPVPLPDKCHPVDFSDGDLVIDLITGRYCYLLYFRVMATAASYQIDVRLMPVDAIPTDDSEITIDFSYQTEVSNVVSDRKLLAHQAIEGAYALDRGICPTNPERILIQSGSRIDWRSVDRLLYQPIDLATGDRVTWHESGVVCQVLNLRLDEDAYSFYQFMVQITPLIIEDDLLQPDPDGMAWVPFKQTTKM